MLPAIFGLSGERLTPDERAFFADADPAGYILFARNCRSPEQLRALTDSLRALSGRSDLPILIDQEGGRVARLQPPAWPSFPAPRRFAELYALAPISAIQAARLNAEAMAVVLTEAGINVNCTPLLDLSRTGTHDVIGDRALGAEPMQVAALGRAVLDGLRAGGALGVVKHAPGHGRTGADSHVELPRVAAEAEALEEDLFPFRSLNWAPCAMTAHVLYEGWDDAQPSTLSAKVIKGIIRGRIGFDGLLISDDITMHALSGPLVDRAQKAIDAGCDLVLHGSGKLDEARSVASGLVPITATSRERLGRAVARIESIRSARPLQELLDQRDRLLAYAPTAVQPQP